MGLLFRAGGNNMSVAEFYSLKSLRLSRASCSPVDFGYSFETLGKGFVFEKLINHPCRSRPSVGILPRSNPDHNLDMMLLDEITLSILYKWLDCNEFIQWIRQNKP
jgi:ATP:corrinoid adenosyltransferase